jgi:HAE1 family hydrophobic/amphiphilic exporter-1
MSPITVDTRNISALWVRRPVTGVMVFACVALVGFFSFSRLKLDLMPNIEFPVVAIITTYNGAGPEAVEQLVTRPIEQAMASVQGVEKMTSTSQHGTSLVMVNFAWGSNMDIAEQDVRKNLEVFADERLPDDAGNPLIFAFDPSMQPVVFMTVNAPGTPDKVRRLADDEIVPYLSRIDGVAAAEVMGGVKRQIQVRVDPDWLQAYGVAATQVVSALRMANVLIPGGRIDQGNLDLNIATDAEFETVDEIRDVVVGQRGGNPIRVRDVAEVADTFEELTHVVLADGQPAVMVAVRKQSDANTVQVVRRVMTALDELDAKLPKEVELVALFDQGGPVTRSLSNLASTALIALFLTGVVLLIFLRSWRTSSIVLVGIPLAVLATFSAMDGLSVTLNMISMAGLALSVGMLVDNAIVVLENIFKKLEAGLSPAEAAVVGTKEMSMPITASTLTTVSVFAPVLFVPGLAGQLFRDMSLTIVISLTASLLVALTLVPLLASLLLGRHAPSAVERLIGRLTAWLDPLSDNYGRFLGRALKRSGLVLIAAFAIFAVTMAMAGLLGADFLPPNDFGQIEFSFEAAPGTSVSETSRLVGDIEAVVREVVPEAEVVSADFGEGEGFTALFGGASHSGMIRVRLPGRAGRSRSQMEIERALRERFDDVPGVEMKAGNAAQAAAFGMGGGDVLVRVFSQDLEELRTFGRALKERIEAVDGAADVTFSLEEGRPELHIDLEREQIRELGLNPAVVAQTVSTYFMGTTATVFREGGEETAVLVRAPREVREDIERLRGLPIMTPLGTSVPLQTVAQVAPVLGPASIAHDNQRRLGTIGVMADGIPLGTLIERVERAIDDVQRPPGVGITIGGAAEDLAESFQALGVAFLVAFLLVYMVMASQFESLLEPFVILGAIPFALSGVVLGLLVTGTTLQVTALIGVILLVGIVVNNGIVLIDVLKSRRLAGEDLVEAAVHAGRLRLRPILMTTLTTVLGMVPLASGIGDGAETWAPMARAVIGGLTVSTLLTLVVVPAAYVKLAGIVDGRARKREKSRKDRDPDGLVAPL